MSRALIPDFRSMADRWPSTVVARSKVGEFSGGILHPRTLANLDSKKVGPRRRIKIGRIVAYPVQDLVEWLEEHAELLD